MGGLTCSLPKGSGNHCVYTNTTGGQWGQSDPKEMVPTDPEIRPNGAKPADRNLLECKQMG